jgi:hypothetical protein
MLIRSARIIAPLDDAKIVWHGMAGPDSWLERILWRATVICAVASGRAPHRLFLFDTKERGPPFGLRQGEHHDLLRDGLVLEADAEVTRSVPVFAGRERWRNGAGSWHRDPVCAT